MNDIDHRVRHDSDREFYRRVFSDDEMKALAMRNDARAKAAQRALGPRWVGVPLKRQASWSAS